MVGKIGNRESMGKGLSTERREHSQGQLPTQRPPCPECGAPDPMSKGATWICRKCGRYFKKIMRGNTKELPDRPKSCPHCKAIEKDEIVIWANGDKWFCKVCGKMWSRHKHSKRKDIGVRPICPYCGTPEPKSHGISWLCVSCGKTWNKIYQRPPQPVLNPVELISAKIIEI